VLVLVAADAAPAPRDADEPCIADAAARAACEKKGAGFAYGPAPWIYCRGVPPRPGEQASYYEAIRNSPCSCNDVEAIRKRREICSRVP